MLELSLPVSSLVQADASFQVNEATLNALVKYFNRPPSLSPPRRTSSYQGSYSPSPPAASFRKLTLNNCGINGREAARLLRAMSNHPGAHLHLDGNPLEDGLEDFCRAISLTPGPAGLHMDMVEFRHEANFVALLKALTANTNIAFLSMAGTAPAPSSHGPCGTEVCQALEAFFQDNQSVHYLDLSGYNGKLDDGQLAPGFARSLRGLASNTTLTHLRIRNQNLHDDVGTLGTVIRLNNTLQMIDCQENNWNLTSLQFLAKSLKLNHSLLQFPLPHPEYERILHRVVADTRRQATLSRAASAVQQEQENVLRTELLRQVHDLRETVMRNRSLAEADGFGLTVDFDESEDTGGEKGWPGLNIKRASVFIGGSASNTTLPAPIKPGLPRTDLRVQTSRSLDFDLDSDLVETPVSIASDDVTRTVHEITTSCSSEGAEESSHDVENPYHVPHDAQLLETPGVDAGEYSPTDCDMPVTPPATTPKSTPSGTSEDLDEAPYAFLSGKEQPDTPSFDMGPYFANTGRDFVVKRFRFGGLEAHEEE